MNGARKIAVAALDKGIDALERKSAALDVCCGDGWARGIVMSRGLQWFGVDQAATTPLQPFFRRIDMGAPDAAEKIISSSPSRYDLIFSAWGIQHLLENEAQAWITCRRLLEHDGLMVYVGRFRQDPGVERARQDPLNGHNLGSVQGLAMTTGLRLKTFDVYAYSGDEMRIARADDEEANAFVATLRKA